MKDKAVIDALPVVAWRVTVPAIDGAAVVGAKTRGRALASAFNNARDLGYPVEWKDFRAKRAPQYDNSKAVTSPGRAWEEDYLPKPPPIDS